MQDKNKKLDSILKKLSKVIVAFSGGVDSTFLLAKSIEVLGRENVLAVTVLSDIISNSEFKDAEKTAKELDVEHKVVHIEVLDKKAFKENPEDRCYLCKKDIFSLIKRIADEKGFKYVVEGANVADLDDYRPGMKAVKELKIKSPLLETGMTKADVRALSKEMGLSTWDKPAKACLASRFPYGEEITSEKLKQVEKAEDYLYSVGFKLVRVRHHGDICRIELAADDIYRFTDHHARRNIVEKLKSFGFKYITFDLEGYRTGSMNETLSDEVIKKEKEKK